MNVLAISGSLRSSSSNSALIRAVAALAPPGISVHIYAGLGELPFFNPDLDVEPAASSVEATPNDPAVSDGCVRRSAASPV